MSFQEPRRKVNELLNNEIKNNINSINNQQLDSNVQKIEQQVSFNNFITKNYLFFKQTILSHLRRRLFSLNVFLSSSNSKQTSLLSPAAMALISNTTVSNSTSDINELRQNQKLSYNDINETSKKSLDRRRRLLKVKERQATLLLGLILTAFIVSWLPFFVS